MSEASPLSTPKRLPVLSSLACLCSGGALPGGWAAAQLFHFRDDFFGLKALALFFAVTGGLALLGVGLALSARWRSEVPRWVSSVALGIASSVLVGLLALWLHASVS